MLNMSYGLMGCAWVPFSWKSHHTCSPEFRILFYYCQRSIRPLFLFLYFSVMHGIILVVVIYTLYSLDKVELEVNKSVHEYDEHGQIWSDLRSRWLRKQACSVNMTKPIAILEYTYKFEPSIKKCFTFVDTSQL